MDAILKTTGPMERRGRTLIARAHFMMRANNLVNIGNDKTINFKQQQREAFDQIREWSQTMVMIVTDDGDRARWLRLAEACK